MNRWDVIFLLGIGLLSMGAAMLSVPVGVIVAGIGLLAFAVIGAQGELPPRPPSPPPGGER